MRMSPNEIDQVINAPSTVNCKYCRDAYWCRTYRNQANRTTTPFIIEGHAKHLAEYRSRNECLPNQSQTFEPPAGPPEPRSYSRYTHNPAPTGASIGTALLGAAAVVGLVAAVDALFDDDE